ncbi:MAG: outer membrane protein transport protein [Deltaproteobacteria bacterium]
MDDRKVEQPMSNMKKMPWAATLAATLVASPAFGAGFQVNEHSAPNTGRASAVTATVDDPSAIFHNPAGLTQTEGTEFQGGVTFIIPRGTYNGPGNNPNGEVVTAEAESPVIPVPNAYVSRALSSKAFVGFGFYLPYGLGIAWKNPDTWVGRTVAQELSLRTFFLTPSIALKLSDMVSVAVGVSLVPATVYLKRVLGATDNGQVLFPTPRYSKEGTVEIAGSAFGVGANAGVQLTLIDNLKIGLALRSAVDLSFSGDADFQLPEEAAPEIRANFPDQGGSANITLPHSVSFGIGWVQDSLTLEASTQVTLWNSYDELRLNFETGRPTPSSASPRDWTVVPLFRVGGQYLIDDLAVRAGLAYDVSPAPDETVDPTLPDNDRFIFSAGAGYDFGFLRADVAYMGLYVFGRDVPAGTNVNFARESDSSYDGGFVHVISTSIGVKI